MESKTATEIDSAHDQVAILSIEEDVNDAMVLLVPKSTFESSLRKHAPTDIDDGFKSLTEWFLKQLKPIKRKDDPRRRMHNTMWNILNEWHDENNFKCIELFECRIMSPFCFLCINSADE